MGSGAYSVKDWTTFSSKRKYSDPKTTTDHIYASRSLAAELDPKRFKLRESVDGDDNPQSTPLILGLDVTGSMSPVLDSIARKGLKTICEEIYTRKPIVDPHICVLGIGDVECDRAPFQATQFEADIRIFEQLEKLYLEQGGGGNNHESYILAWYFAKYRTITDCFRKRGKKGFIFTIGDEEITPGLTSQHIQRHMGDGQAGNHTANSLFEAVRDEWEIFHVILRQGTHARSHFKQVHESWQKVIGAQRVIPLDDYTKTGEVIVSALELMSGKSMKEVSGSWDGTTAVVVDAALSGVTSGSKAMKSVDQYL